MELERKTVQVTNVERAKVMVESVVEKLIIDGEVAGRLASIFGRDCRWPIDSSRASLVRRSSRYLRVWKVGFGRRSLRIRCEIEAVYNRR